MRQARLRQCPAAAALCVCLACGNGDTGMGSVAEPAGASEREAGAGRDAAVNPSLGSPDAANGDAGAAGANPGSGGHAGAASHSDGGPRFDAGLLAPDAGGDHDQLDAGPDAPDGSVEPSVDGGGFDLDAAPQDAGSTEVDTDAGANDAAVTADAGSVGIEMARNVIFLMADGYGAEQIEATRIYVNGNTAALSFEGLPYQAWVETNNARNQTTDSAAAATAFATGHKVDSSVISVAIPGNSGDLPTALEIQRARGKRVGLVTAHTPITDASPAAFGAHAASRNDTSTIAATFFDETRPNILFGLTDTGITALAAQAAGYTVVANAAQLAALDLDTETHISGQFTEGTLPPLQDLAMAALDVLDESSAGFFLLVEQEQTDSAGHLNNLSTVISAAIEFNTMVEQVLAWAQGRDDTLVIVGADHETGGLTLNEPTPTQGVVPGHSYATTGHSNADVRFFATGVGASRLTGTLDNTELFPLFAGYQVTSCGDSSACVAGARHHVLRAATPNTAVASGTLLTADLSDSGFEVQSLLAFPELSDLLPMGCTLRAAHLVLPVSNGSTAGIRLHRMLDDWSASSTWNSFGGNGIQANGSEASVAADAQSAATSIGVLTFDVTAAVTGWLSNPSSNHGWVLLANGTDGMDVASPANSSPPDLRLFCD
ncbi:MAG TPA: alkaline phosphatase [Polyangiaceae bacterium]|nr:alkaline phosphatase [Polyangiaceae bacterium]